ncbi:MAG TPA: STAS domain-containing protein [Candidatus Acidoferrales bacterium]|jgi:anti-anti-sigma factor|nr:STAS domain-containing protein [Candidatus Acidoferrales bacterium]
MQLTIRTEKQHDALTLYCSGALIAESAPLLKSHVKEMFPHEKHITLDLAGLSRMDSAGLGALVSLYVSAHKAGVEIQFVNMSAPIRELLGLTHLLSVFESAGRNNTRLP